MELKKVLLKIDRTSDYDLRETLFKGYEYIDTPGDYKSEKKYYSDVFDYYKSNMGEESYKKLIEFLNKHPKEVSEFMRKK